MIDNWSEVASDWAFNQRHETVDGALAFGKWYAETFPEGDKALTTAYDYWKRDVAV